MSVIPIVTIPVRNSTTAWSTSIPAHIARRIERFILDGLAA